MSIKQGVWNDLKCVSLSSGGYEAVIITEVGANVISFRNEEKGYDILRTPPSAEAFVSRPQVYGIPILLPPNRIAGGRFSMGGRDYSFPINSTHNNHIHGIMLRAKWRFSHEDGNQAVFSYRFDEKEAAHSFFPHTFEATLKVGISGGALTHELEFTNTGAEPMPFGLGYHTAFNLPFVKGGSAENCRMRLNVHRQLLLGENNIPTGELVNPVGNHRLLTDAGRPLQEDMFDSHFTADLSSKFHGAQIADYKYTLLYEVDRAFSYWTIWNSDAKSGFVCPEPQTCAINAFNMKDGGAILLAPGESKTLSTKISVKEG